MSARALAGAFLGIALLLHFGYTLETRRAAGAEQKAYARARLERARLEARLAALMRDEAGWRRAAGMDPSDPRAEGGASGPASPSPPEQAPARLRESVLHALEGSSLGGVHIGVSPGRGPVAASLSLTATGTFKDIVRFSGRLVRPGAGVVLQQVRITPTKGQTLDFAVLGVSLGARP